MILQANYTRTRSYQGLKGFLPLLNNLIFARFAVLNITPDVQIRVFDNFTANAIGSFYEANSNCRLYNTIIYQIYNFRHKKKDFIVTLLDLSLIEKSTMYLWTLGRYLPKVIICMKLVAWIKNNPPWPNGYSIRLPRRGPGFESRRVFKLFFFEFFFENLPISTF